MKPWVLVDFSYLIHRAAYAVTDLYYEDFHTGILFGFWEQLRAICSDPAIKSTKVALMLDSKKSFRKQSLPTYKAPRAEQRSEAERELLQLAWDQVRLLRDILPTIGFPLYLQTGCESDDLMAQAARQLAQRRDHSILITADGDLWQCIGPFTTWYDPSHHRMYDLPTFRLTKHIAPSKWGLVKALAGCSSDNVPGIPGVGEFTAIKYLKGQLPAHYKTSQAIRSLEGLQTFRRNKELVVLPHPKTKLVSLAEPEYKPDAFFDMCKRYGFLSYMKEPKRGEWMSFFEGLPPRQTRKRGQHGCLLEE